MDGNEGHPDPQGEQGKDCKRVPFNASLDEERERDQDNDRAADGNTNPVHALLELEEIGKPGVLTLHFVEDIGDRRARRFRRAAAQCSHPAYEGDGKRYVCLLVC